MKNTYRELDATAQEEREEFLLSFIDYMAEQKKGGPYTLPAKDAVLGFFNKDEQFLPNISLETLHRLYRSGQLYAVQSAFMAADTPDAFPLPSPGKDGPNLLSDLFNELFYLGETESSLFIPYCKTFMALICNLINPAPDDIRHATMLVDVLRDKLCFLMLKKPHQMCDEAREELIGVGKQVLTYLANGGIPPEQDISIAVRDGVTHEAITDCTALAERLLNMSGEGGFRVMGGLIGYGSLTNYGGISLSDFVTICCLLPEPDNHDEDVTKWMNISNFVTMLIYGVEEIKDEDKNIFIFGQLMKVKATLKTSNKTKH